MGMLWDIVPSHPRGSHGHKQGPFARPGAMLNNFRIIMALAGFALNPRKGTCRVRVSPGKRGIHPEHTDGDGLRS